MVDLPQAAPPDFREKMEKFLDNKNEVFGTPETLARFATIKDRLAVIAKKDLVIVSPDDVFPPGQATDTDSAIRRMQDIFNAAGLPPDAIKMQQMLLYLKNADANSPFANGIDLNGDQRTDLAVVLAPKHENKSDIGILSAFSGVPGARLHSIPGSASDYAKLFMFHEARHAGQMEEMPNPLDMLNAAHVRGLESDADKEALREGLRAGVSMDVVKTFIRMREASTINQFSLFSAALNPSMSWDQDDGAGNHTTHVYISGAGFKSSPEKMDERLTAMENVNAVLNMASARYAYSEAGDLYLKDRLGDDRRAGLPSKKEFEQMNPLDAGQFVNFGRVFAQSNPAFTYLMLERLKSEGVFKPGSEEDRYINDVRNFYKKHVDLSDLKSPDMQAAREKLDRSFLPGLEEMQAVAVQMKRPGLEEHPRKLEDIFGGPPMKMP
jgi:hypothetical protein